MNTEVTLTEEEQHIIHYLAQGMDQEEISKKLFVSRSSLQSKLYRLRERLNCKNSTELVAVVIERLKK